MNYESIIEFCKRLDLEVIDEYNGWVRIVCPFAQWRHAGGTDHNPSCGIKIEDGEASFYNCLTCKSKGPVHSIAQELSKLVDDPELAKYALQVEHDEMLGISSIAFRAWEKDHEKKSVKKIADRVAKAKITEYEFVRRYKSVLLYPEAIRYLRRRGISISTAFALGLRFDPGRERRIIFPVYDYWTGKFAGYTGRTIRSNEWIRRHELRVQGYTGKRKYKFPKIRDYGGLEKHKVLLFRRPSYTGNRRTRRLRLPSLIRSTYSAAIVVEGLFGFANIWNARPGVIVFALLGSALTEHKAAIIADLGLPVYWLTDNDEAGQAAMHGTLDPETGERKNNGGLRMLDRKVPQFIMKWPPAANDSNKRFKTDPDELTPYEIERMMERAELFTGY
jgi:hypothetical protein